MSALDFLAEMSVHVADRGQHQVLYFGYHSKRSRAELVEALAAGQTLAFVDLGVLFTESSSIAIKPYWA